jgi:hypothetical protein
VQWERKVLEIEKCLMVPSYQTLPIDLTPNQPVEMWRLGPRITRELKGYHHLWEWEWEWSGSEMEDNKYWIEAIQDVPYN